MPYVACCVPGCGSKKGGLTPLHHMPRTPGLLSLWLSYLGSLCPGLSVLNPKQLQAKLICKKHFEERFFRNGVRLQQSCPTLFSAEEISTGIPLRPVKLKCDQVTDHSYCRINGDHTYASRYYSSNENWKLPEDSITELNKTKPDSPKDNGSASEEEETGLAQYLESFQPLEPMDSDGDITCEEVTEETQQTEETDSENKICQICLAIGVKVFDMQTYKLVQCYNALVGYECKESDETLLKGACYECAALLKKFYKFRAKAQQARCVLEKIQSESECEVSIDREEMGLASLLSRCRQDGVEIEPTGSSIPAEGLVHRPIKEEPPDGDATEKESVQDVANKTNSLNSQTTSLFQQDLTTTTAATTARKYYSNPPILNLFQESTTLPVMDIIQKDLMNIPLTTVSHQHEMQASIVIEQNFDSFTLGDGNLLQNLTQPLTFQAKKLSCIDPLRLSIDSDVEGIGCPSRLKSETEQSDEEKDMFEVSVPMDDECSPLEEIENLQRKYPEKNVRKRTCK